MLLYYNVFNKHLQQVLFIKFYYLVMMVPVECYIFFFFFEAYSVLFSAFFSAALIPLLSLLVCGQQMRSVLWHMI